MPELPAGCEGVCYAEDPTTGLPSLDFEPSERWCAGCSALKTPWATTDEQKKNAVFGYLRAYGPGPTWWLLGMPSDGGGLTGVYDANGKPHAGFSVHVQTEGEPCGRLSSLKFSTQGDLGAHVLERVGNDQFFYEAAPDRGASLFQSGPRFTWSGQNVMHEQGINDMWFSRSKIAIDLSGAVWVADLARASATAASQLSGAGPGDYVASVVVGDTVFVGRALEERTEWWALGNERLEPFLGRDGVDIRELAADGEWLAWVERKDPVPPATSGDPVSYRSAVLVRARYVTDPRALEPEVVLANAPLDLGHLVIANERLVGTYLLDRTQYRSGAIVIALDSGRPLRADLESTNSWGYELYPARDALWGAVTSGPMLAFETVARYPYASMPAYP